MVAGDDFIDITKEGRKLKISKLKNQEKWEIINKGLNIIGICKNSDCNAYNKKVICNYGYCSFNIYKDMDNYFCPICNVFLDNIDSILFYQCKYSFIGKKIERNIININTNLYFANKYYIIYSQNEVGYGKFKNLIINTENNNNNEEFDDNFISSNYKNLKHYLRNDDDDSDTDDSDSDLEEDIKIDKNKKYEIENGYKIIKELSGGKGTFGKTYLVLKESDNKIYVKKEIDLEKLTKEEILLSLQEIEIIKNIKNENIIEYIDSYSKKNKLNIIMNYCKKRDLNKKIEKRFNNGKQHFKEKTILNYLKQILNGLKFIHQNKIIHRDIKPENIFLTENNIIKIGDFGLSKIVDSLYSNRSQAGTSMYWSLQMLYNDSYTYKTDIWSLGMTLIKMCNLELPSGKEMFQKTTKNKNPEIYGEYSDFIKKILVDMLQLDEEDRISSEELYDKVCNELKKYE